MAMDGRRFDVIAEQGRDDRGHDQQDDHKVVQLFPQHVPEGGTRRFAQLVLRHFG
jgi:hypothetical protein